ncbi:MAG: hypothetical protein KatS3mg111_0208 [Pirellulaceae bacterium]|nr:MAG: hypothetical protein KatS3mg111_0208 [Pirellulaceae bacterium]
MVTPEVERRLVDAAIEMRQRAYAPYSAYRVGAAVFAGDNYPLFVGCNVENASYGLTVCAERNAVAAMIGGGASQVLAIAVATEDGASPCGACRQVLAEFGQQAIVLRVATASGRIVHRHTMAELLPDCFRSHEQ